MDRMTRRSTILMSGKAQRGGFTMLEFSGAMVIALILSIIAVAGFRVFERELPLRHGSKRLVQAFSAARSFAIARNSNFVVRIDKVAKNFWIDETDPRGVTTLPKVTRPEELGPELEVTDVYYGQARIADSERFLFFRFYPDGSADDARVMLRRVDTEATDDTSYDTIRLYGPTAQSEVFSGQRLLPTP